MITISAKAKYKNESRTMNKLEICLVNEFKIDCTYIWCKCLIKTLVAMVTEIFKLLR